MMKKLFYLLSITLLLFNFPISISAKEEGIHALLVSGTVYKSGEAVIDNCEDVTVEALTYGNPSSNAYIVTATAGYELVCDVPFNVEFTLNLEPPVELEYAAFSVLLPYVEGIDSICILDDEGWVLSELALEEPPEIYDLEVEEQDDGYYLSWSTFSELSDVYCDVDYISESGQIVKLAFDSPETTLEVSVSELLPGTEGHFVVTAKNGYRSVQETSESVVLPDLDVEFMNAPEDAVRFIREDGLFFEALIYDYTDGMMTDVSSMIWTDKNGKNVAYGSVLAMVGDKLPKTGKFTYTLTVTNSRQKSFSFSVDFVTEAVANPILSISLATIGIAAGIVVVAVVIFFLFKKRIRKA